MSSGLASSASTWSFATVSPACTRSVTVPAAGAYRVGLTAATTRPCAETSRTSVPRVTGAVRTCDAATERFAPSTRVTLGKAKPASSSAATTIAAIVDLALRVGRRRGHDAVGGGGVADHRSLHPEAAGRGVVLSDSNARASPRPAPAD